MQSANLHTAAIAHTTSSEHTYFLTTRSFAQKLNKKLPDRSQRAVVLRGDVVDGDLRGDLHQLHLLAEVDHVLDCGPCRDVESDEVAFFERAVERTHAFRADGNLRGHLRDHFRMESVTVLEHRRWHNVPASDEEHQILAVSEISVDDVDRLALHQAQIFAHGLISCRLGDDSSGHLVERDVEVFQTHLIHCRRTAVPHYCLL